MRSRQLPVGLALIKVFINEEKKLSIVYTVLTIQNLLFEYFVKKNTDFTEEIQKWYNSMYYLFIRKKKNLLKILS